MILTVEELRKYIETAETDDVLNTWIEAVTNTIHNYTHNSFQKYMVDGVINYPADVKMGVINLLKWELTMRDKSFVESETISRHSVNYLNVNAYTTECGYPKSLLCFLQPYRKARFGQWGGH